jgi:CRISPR-associated protein Csx14
MAEASIPVDLFNPGQVFACLGFLEAAEMLIGDAEGGFDWREPGARFDLRAPSEDNPFAVVLDYLSTIKLKRWAPVGYVDPPPKNRSEEQAEQEVGSGGLEIDYSETFIAREGDRMSLPIQLESGNLPSIRLGHWADGSTRNSFKLYAGNRSGAGIAIAMLSGVRSKLKKGVPVGEIKSRGIRQLWEEQRASLLASPFDVLTPMGGRFNFDPRAGWTPIEAGYSPDQQDHQVSCSPVVEFLAGWGLENARPQEFSVRQVRYAVWGVSLPPILARAALSGALSAVPLQFFTFELDLSGKNKIVTFAQMENRS